MENPDDDIQTKLIHVQITFWFIELSIALYVALLEGSVHQYIFSPESFLPDLWNQVHSTLHLP